MILYAVRKYCVGSNLFVIQKLDEFEHVFPPRKKNISFLFSLNCPRF